MDKSIVQKYIDEMKRMQEIAKRKNSYPVQASAAPANPKWRESNFSEEELTGNGYMEVNVTAARSLFPVKHAKITIFKQNIEDMVPYSTVYTDESGKTPKVQLPAPPKSLSLYPESDDKPYIFYNILAQADGFADNIIYNAAVFDGVTSIQSINLKPLAALNNKSPEITDTYEDYPL